MLRVVRITGESFDLESGGQLPKTVVISNGITELAIPVDDDTAMEILRLGLSEEEEEPQSVAPDPDEYTIPSTPQPERFHLVPDEPAESGEDYDDPLTGAASI